MMELPCLEATLSSTNRLHNGAVKSVLINKIKTKDYCKELGLSPDNGRDNEMYGQT